MMDNTVIDFCASSGCVKSQGLFKHWCVLLLQSEDLLELFLDHDTIRAMYNAVGQTIPLHFINT